MKQDYDPLKYRTVNVPDHLSNVATDKRTPGLHRFHFKKYYSPLPRLNLSFCFVAAKLGRQKLCEEPEAVVGEKTAGL